MSEKGSTTKQIILRSSVVSGDFVVMVMMDCYGAASWRVQAKGTTTTPIRRRNCSYRRRPMARRALQAAETENGGGSRNPSAIVIGAGPAGAAAALALARTRRWDVRVFERRMEACEASAHPSSWNVTLTRRAFDTLEELV